MPPSDEQVRQVLAGVREPVLHRTLGELDLAGPVSVDGGTVEVTVFLLTDEHPAIPELDSAIFDALASLPDVQHITVHHAVLDDERRAGVVDRLHSGTI